MYGLFHVLRSYCLSAGQEVFQKVLISLLTGACYFNHWNEVHIFTHSSLMCILTVFSLLLPKSQNTQCPSCYLTKISYRLPIPPPSIFLIWSSRLHFPKRECHHCLNKQIFSSSYSCISLRSECRPQLFSLSNKPVCVVLVERKANFGIRRE